MDFKFDRRIGFLLPVEIYLACYNYSNLNLIEINLFFLFNPPFCPFSNILNHVYVFDISPLVSLVLTICAKTKRIMHGTYIGT